MPAFLEKGLTGIGADRIIEVSPDYFEILGTDRIEDTSKCLGEKFALYRARWSYNPKKQIIGDFPLHLDIESNNTCNLRCPMCQIPFKKMKTGYMDLELLDKVLSEAKSHSLPSVKFNFRGEPLMHPGIIEFIRRAKGAGIMEVQLNSNGALLNDKLSKGLIEAGLDRLKFSVDGVSPETYNSIRKGTSYEETIPKILEFIDMRNRLNRKIPIVQVQMVYMASNHQEAERYIEFWQDKVNRIGFSRYRSGYNILGTKGRIKELGQRIPCQQLWQRLVITWDGTVLMCCGDHQMKNPIGNLIDNTLFQIWTGDRLNGIRELHKKRQFDIIDACSNCEVNYK
jgi:radical SAM protein with 4Fe4S-binding SPASM domain